MNEENLYKQAYRILNNITPLHGDCGELCNAMCCKAEDDETGMYLFPGEEVMYKNMPTWAKISESSFEYVPNRKALILICNGTCDRNLRPLACRIFPLTPYFDGDNLTVVMDSRGKGICPLASVAEIGKLRQDFVKKVWYTFKFLTYNSHIRSFVKGLSALLDSNF